MVSTTYACGRPVVTQLGSAFPYACEYTGATPRLVVTPPGERAFLALTAALRGHVTSAVVGPAATGKTDTLTDLAQVF